MTHVLPAGTTLAEVRDSYALPLDKAHFGAQLFEGRSRDFVAAMCNHQLESTDTLIPHIHFESTLDRELIQAATANSDFIDNDTWDVLYENLFEERLLRYLRGTGHPDHPDVIAVVGVEEYSRSLGDPVLRSRLFLHTVSGSDLVPLDPNWKLRVSVPLFVLTSARAMLRPLGTDQIQTSPWQAGARHVQQTRALAQSGAYSSISLTLQSHLASGSSKFIRASTTAS